MHAGLHDYSFSKERRVAFIILNWRKHTRAAVPGAFLLLPYFPSFDLTDGHKSSPRRGEMRGRQRDPF
jgi:hypothetical protein